MADLAFLKGFQFFDSSGDPLNGGLIRIYDAGTTSTRTVYQDTLAATPWSQPITLTSAGRLTGSIYVPEGAWKFLITTAADTSFASPIVSEDNIPGATASATSFATPLTPILSKSANYTIVAADLGSVIRADATGGAFTLTLPSAAATTSGKGFWVMQVGTSGAVTLATVSSQTINGVTTFVLRPQYAHVWIVSDGTNWSAQPSKLLAAAAAKTTTYTVTPADDGRLIKCDATSAGFTVTLPTVALAGDGFRVGVIKTDASANVVTVDGDGAETLDGAANYALNSRYDSVWLRCDGSAWWIEEQPKDAQLTVWAGYTLAQAVAAMSPATTSLQGPVLELATTAETTTGTDTARVVTPDGLAGSIYGTFVVSILVYSDAEDVSTGDGAGDVFWRVPSMCNGMDLVAVGMHVQTAGVTGTLTVQIANVTQAADMLSTRLTIDTGEKDTITAAAAAVIDAGNDDVVTGDEIRIDVDVTQTTKAKGLIVDLAFRTP